MKNEMLVHRETLHRASRYLAHRWKLERMYVAGLLYALWEWGMETGFHCQGPNAAQHLAAALQWTGEEKQLVQDLVEAGVLERTNEGLRVLGAKEGRS